MDEWDFSRLLRNYGKTHWPRDTMICNSGDSVKLFCQGKVELESCNKDKYFYDDIRLI